MTQQENGSLESYKSLFVTCIRLLKLFTIMYHFRSPVFEKILMTGSE
jgi:hypothetical protein